MVDNRDKSVPDVGHDHHPVPGAAGPIGRAVRDHVDFVGEAPAVYHSQLDRELDEAILHELGADDDPC